MIQSSDSRLQGIGQVFQIHSLFVKLLYLDPVVNRMSFDDRCSPHTAIASWFARFTTSSNADSRPPSHSYFILHRNAPRARDFALTSCPPSSLPDDRNRQSHRLSRHARSLPRPPLLSRRSNSHLPPRHDTPTISHSSIRHAHTTRAHHHVLTPSHWPRALTFPPNQRDLRQDG